MSVVLENSGTCPICERNTMFRSNDPWLRDNYMCTGGCNSIPRERALMAVLQQVYPNWRELAIHESSPTPRGVSEKLAKECPKYLASQYDLRFESGYRHPSGYRCEDLENQTFANGCFDLVITQDVMEHVLDPDAAFREIARTLRPGGAHVFTVPLVRGCNPTQVRAGRSAAGAIVHHLPPVYHGNPISSDGSLVITDWGLDIVPFILAAGGMVSTIFQIDRLDWGIRAALNDVIVSWKLAS